MLKIARYKNQTTAELKIDATKDFTYGEADALAREILKEDGIVGVCITYAKNGVAACAKPPEGWINSVYSVAKTASLTDPDFERKMVPTRIRYMQLAKFAYDEEVKRDFPSNLRLGEELELKWESTTKYFKVRIEKIDPPTKENESPLYYVKQLSGARQIAVPGNELFYDAF